MIIGEFKMYIIIIFYKEVGELFSNIKQMEIKNDKYDLQQKKNTDKAQI